MKKKILFMAFAIIMAMPMLFAGQTETTIEIQLYEVVDAGLIEGDAPFDNPRGQSNIPPRPTDFHATITGRVLAVTADNSNYSNVIVRNSAGNTIISSSFYGFTTEQLSSTGAYTIEIQNGGMTLTGYFNVK